MTTLEKIARYIAAGIIATIIISLTVLAVSMKMGYGIECR